MVLSDGKSHVMSKNYEFDDAFLVHNPKMLERSKPRPSTMKVIILSHGMDIAKIIGITPA